MGSTRFQSDSPPKLGTSFQLATKTRRALPVLAILIGLAGCSTDQYLMVPKSNMETVTSSVQSQRATLVTMESNANVRHDQTMDGQSASTQLILDAISTQVKAPECPPIPKQRACPAATEAKAVASQLKGKLIVGEVEKFFLPAANAVFNARIDSGAETSSIDSRNIVRFERDGNNWVRFDLPIPGNEEMLTLEKEISRGVKVLQSNTDDAERRVVVELQFAIGSHAQLAEFTLTDRSHLSHQVLIGRNVLRDVMLIDVGKEFATKLPADLISGSSQGATQ